MCTRQACDLGVADPVKLARWMVRFSSTSRISSRPIQFAMPPHLASSAWPLTAAKSASAATLETTPLPRSTPPNAWPCSMATSTRSSACTAAVSAVRTTSSASPKRCRSSVVTMTSSSGPDGASPRRVGGRWPSSTILRPASIADEGTTRRFSTAPRPAQPDALGELLRPSQEGRRDVGVWPHQRDAARSVLAAHDLGALVDVLLGDEEPETAWRAVADNPDRDPGDRRWLRLAEAREGSHPGDALEVYLRLTDRELETAGRASYGRATKMLNGPPAPRLLPAGMPSSPNTSGRCVIDIGADRP